MKAASAAHEGRQLGGPPPKALPRFPSVCSPLPNGNSNSFCAWKPNSQARSRREGRGPSHGMCSCYLRPGFLLAFLCGPQINDTILRKLSECPRGLPWKMPNLHWIKERKQFLSRQKTERVAQCVDHCGDFKSIWGEICFPGVRSKFYFMDAIIWCSCVFCKEASQLRNLKKKGRAI